MAARKKKIDTRQTSLFDVSFTKQDAPPKVCKKPKEKDYIVGLIPGGTRWWYCKVCRKQYTPKSRDDTYDRCPVSHCRSKEGMWVDLSDVEKV